jgi:hypothetical protein
MPLRLPRGWCTLIAAGLLSLAWTGAAHSIDTCRGSLTATLLQSLPTSIVAGLDIHDRSARNLKLADRFMTGVRDAGVTIGPQPNLLLHVDMSVLGSGGPSSSRMVERNYQDLSGLRSGSQVALAPIPSSGLSTTTRRAAPTPPLLYLRIDATAGTETRISWVASVQCQMIGTDEGLLAQQLGRVVGGALGQRIERRPL